MSNDLLFTETRTCINCGEEIKRFAKKCKYCSSYQDWRRFLYIQIPTLSLITALTSIIGITLTNISGIFENKRSIVTITDVGRSGPIYLLALNNSGNAQAKIANAGLIIYAKDGNCAYESGKMQLCDDTGNSDAMIAASPLQVHPNLKDINPGTNLVELSIQGFDVARTSSPILARNITYFFEMIPDRVRDLHVAFPHHFSEEYVEDRLKPLGAFELFDLFVGQELAPSDYNRYQNVDKFLRYDVLVRVVNYDGSIEKKQYP